MDRSEFTMDKVSGKILLLGEYSVLTGSDALSIPFPKYWGRLLIPNGKNNSRQRHSNTVLYQFAEYLAKEIRIQNAFRFDQRKLENDLKEGLYFESSVPVNYGLGSSGALVAAVFKEYVTSEIDLLSLEELKEIFAAAESFFHGHSSGIDPLTSFISRPLHFKKDRINVLEPETESRIKDQIYLYNSGITSGTGNLVSIFQDKLKDGEFEVKYKRGYFKLINETIEKLIRNDIEALTNGMRLISRFQLENFEEMIPPGVIPLFERGLNSGDYTMKLCGSGGGGYFIVHSDRSVKLVNTYFNHPLESV